MEKITKEIFVGAILVVLLAALINPGDFLMPTMTQMSLIVAATVAFAIFAVLLWRERGGDERDSLHRLVADRAAFQIGAAVLMIAIVSEGFNGMIDAWLPITLGAIVLGKIVGLIYSKKKY